MTYGVTNGHVSDVTDDVTWPQRCCEAVGYASDCLVTFLYKDVPMLITMKNNVEVSHGLFYH